MSDFLRFDFGYTWPWTYGHLIAALALAALAAAAWWLRWRISAALLGLGAVWGLVGSLIVHGPLAFNRPLSLPTERFLASGEGRVLDGGAGSGRATVMVLRERPGASVVALDIFAAGYGIGDNTPERLLDNVRAAGAEGRAIVQRGDLREMPFADGTFDAAVSAYAIDHLNRQGVAASLSEMARVLRPDGEFLLMVIHPDGWIRTAFPFLTAHGYFGPRTAAEHWVTELETAGLKVVEQGTRPGTLYFIAAAGSAPSPPFRSPSRKTPETSRSVPGPASR